jgi:hypothetical protein
MNFKQFQLIFINFHDVGASSCTGFKAPRPSPRTTFKIPHKPPPKPTAQPLRASTAQALASMYTRINIYTVIYIYIYIYVYIYVYRHINPRHCNQNKHSGTISRKTHTDLRITSPPQASQRAPISTKWYKQIIKSCTTGYKKKRGASPTGVRWESTCAQ